MAKISRIWGEESGQTLILAMAAFVVVVGVLAISLDVGEAYGDKARAQRAADAAAIAAADVLASEGGVAAATAAAVTWANENGYGLTEDEITINIPPETGPYTGNPDYAEVIIDHVSEAHFAKAFGVSLWEIQARAVAGGTNGTAEAYGIIALSEDECRAISFSGTIDVHIEGAGIYSNSDCQPDSFYANGSVNVETDSNIVVGGYEGVGAVNVTPTPTNGSHIEDPLGDVLEPTPPTSPVRSCPDFGGPPGTVTLQPGYYDCPTFAPPGNKNLDFLPGNYYITGGINITGSLHHTFGAGIYSLGGAGLLVSGSSSITADEVMFHIVDGGVDLAGTGDVSLHAPSSGTYKGIAIFQARDNDNQINLRGESLGDGWGTVYAQAANITMVGTSDTINLQFISDTFHMTGTSGIHIVWDDNILAEGGPILALVE